MRYTEHRWMNPSAPSEDEIFEVYYATRQFYQETQYREDLDRASVWYHTLAAQNRRELEKMRGDINLLGWFCRKRER
ncbi:hypothetical protein C7B65_05305 [Phormidesmis priestleyi ULC007]|uniref:Uncharacterized protein n=1 Tax=Phormidesmis priestleyi ULC007 TaxID=1920490 RepID=A0A2T1DK04_9CYAN|nr:hypothetical protein [Phormidesmis priestleyi]PSB20827.1 hypothetical protein C7B65_05305 [Phormidesmis priestleyi ULC007]PZO51782.1 MAG: hypothetical protein DCF14_07450 [Phormidesmis priestleyi]